MIEAVLFSSDTDRIAATLARLRLGGLQQFALTGGIAIAWHQARMTSRTQRRPLNDLDLVVPTARAIPSGLAEGFCIVRWRPAARPGRLLLQAVEPRAALRVDLFGSFGRQFDRSLPTEFAGRLLRIVSAEDLAGRLAALLLDLALGETLPGKHARDFAALAPHVDPTGAEGAWADHRRQRHPATFAEAAEAATALVHRERHRLVEMPALTVASLLRGA